MRVIVETQGRVRARMRRRFTGHVSRLLRAAAGVPIAPEATSVTFRRISRVRSVVGSVVPRRLVEDDRVRAMALDLVFGSVHVAFALVNIIVGLLARSPWTFSVGVVVATLNSGKSYLASGALMSVAADGRTESKTSLIRCGRAGVALVVITLAFSGTIANLVLQGFGRTYPGLLMYAYAAYALVSIVLAVVNLVRSRRLNVLAITGVRLFNLASALVSIFALQTVIISHIVWDDLPAIFTRNLAEGATGGIVCLYMVATGLWLALTAYARLANRRGYELRLRPGRRPRRR